MGALILGFRTSHAALRAERGFKAAGLEVELIPMPRQISSDCGFCLRAKLEDEGAALKLASELGCSEAWRERAMEGKRYERIE